MWRTAEFLASLLQSSMSHAPSEIILIWWFAAKESFFKIIIIISVKKYFFVKFRIKKGQYKS